MTTKTDTRWMQRLEKYCKAFEVLDELIRTVPRHNLSTANRLALVKSFELVYEMAWQTLKDFLECAYADQLKSDDENGDSISGSADAFSYAIKYKLISNGAPLLAAIKDRNLTVHTYNEDTATKISNHILNQYYDAFKEVRDALLKQKQQRGL